MKVLFVSHVANFQKFNKPFMLWFKEQGWEVHYASLDDEEVENVDAFHKIDIRRRPYDLTNIKALFQLISLMKKEKYDMVHCHTPMGGILARFAAKFFSKIKVIYTAHGFHFYKGAPKTNFLIYRTAERLFAHRTDALVTINQEDFEAAKKFRLRKGGKLYYIHGVGVDLDTIYRNSPDKSALKKQLGIPEDKFVILTVAELIVRKNYPVALEAFAKADIENAVYLICGVGTEEQNIRAYADKLGISGKVIFAGYRRDIKDIIKIADLFLFTSNQEGLPIAIIEAMAAGLPVIASRIRGNTELITDNGILLEKSDINGYGAAIKKLYNDAELRTSMGKNSLKNVKPYDVKIAVEKMAEIYNNVMKLP